MQEEIERGRVVFGKDETTTPKIRTNLFEQDKEVMRSVYFSYAQTATQEFNKLFDNIRIFENPKNPNDIQRLVEYVTTKNDGEIIIDFFSGSATTAHAVMQLNAEDGGNRQYIMVQLPELCDEKSEAYKAGYKNICEIGKERIRRAGAKILAQAEEQRQQTTLDSGEKPLPDVGFRVFKLDTSNLKTWDATPIEGEVLATLYERMNGMIQRIKPDRTDLDLVFEVMLKLGVPLNYAVTPVPINNKTAYSVGEDCLLLICLAPDIQPEDVEQMAEYVPAKAVIASDSFADDTAISNAYYILRDRGVALKLL